MEGRAGKHARCRGAQRSRRGPCPRGASSSRRTSRRRLRSGVSARRGGAGRRGGGGGRAGDLRGAARLWSRNVCGCGGGGGGGDSDSATWGRGEARGAWGGAGAGGEAGARVRRWGTYAVGDGFCGGGELEAAEELEPFGDGRAEERACVRGGSARTSGRGGEGAGSGLTAVERQAGGARELRREGGRAGQTQGV